MSQSLVQEVSAFVEVCVHTILSNRFVYPAALFEPRRAFGLPVVACRHPALNQYVHALAQSVQAWLVAGQMQRIVIALLDPPRSKTNPDGAVARLLERFVFELCLMAPSSSSSAAASDNAIPAADLAVLHEQFASVLLRLSACGGHFTKSSGERTWTVLLYTNEATPTGPPASSPLARNTDAPALRWQPVPLVAPAADSPAATAAAAGASSSPPPFLDFPAHQNRLMSLRSIRTPLLHMEVYCEAPAD